MSSPLQDVYTYLQTISSLGLTGGTNLYVSLMTDDPIPEQPDDVVVITETPGVAPEWTMGSTLPAIEEVNVQVLSRMNEENYLNNENRIWAIYRATAQVTNQVVNGTTYLWWEPLHTPSFMHRDQKRRIYHVYSFAPMRQPNEDT